MGSPSHEDEEVVGGTMADFASHFGQLIVVSGREFEAL
jgi:hypothetical protein